MIQTTNCILKKFNVNVSHPYFQSVYKDRYWASSVWRWRAKYLQVSEYLKHHFQIFISLLNSEPIGSRVVAAGVVGPSTRTR